MDIIDLLQYREVPRKSRLRRDESKPDATAVRDLREIVSPAGDIAPGLSFARVGSLRQRKVHGWRDDLTAFHDHAAPQPASADAMGECVSRTAQRRTVRSRKSS